MKQAIFTRCCATVWAPVRRRRWAACWPPPLTKELLHAGFESASTARLVNIALALKSDDESAVALDALSIDLYTGDAVLYKAGAAASFLLRDGKAAVYSGDTLPIGILGSVTGRRELLCLSPAIPLCW